MSSRKRSLGWIGALTAAALLAGCVGNAGDSARLRQQAQAALSRWADAVAAAGGPSPVVLVGELIGQVGDWEVGVGDDNKSALMAGLIVATDGLPTETPPDGDVAWPDGTTTTVPLMSAPEAVNAMQAAFIKDQCMGCASLRVTGARLTSGPIDTSRGSATGPIWEFTIAGTAVKVTRVAIAHTITVVPPAWNPNDPPRGVRIDAANGIVGDRELTVTFIGAPDPGDRPCGEDYTTEAVESDLAVVVIVIRHPYPTLGACSAVGATRTATVNLASPLGSRAVLEIQGGTPVPVTLTR